MKEVKTINGEVLFSYDENTTTLKEEISKRKYLVCADLRGVDLGNADLRLADLRGAKLKGANLKGANIRWADLSGADLTLANLKGIDLRMADLSDAKIDNANLKNADLMNANLSCARLRWANLTGANLTSANLIGAELRWTDLKGADLKGADLKGAHLIEAKNIPDGLPMACPTEGSFIAWKKVECHYLVKLEIPEDAKRSSATSKKCRCDKAKVLEIIDMNTGENIDEVVNTNYTLCTYTVGEMVYPDWFDDNRWRECSNGIHFFVDREDAENYWH